MEAAFRVLLTVMLAILVSAILFGLLRAILGPRKADRILGINMVGSLTTLCLAVLSVLLKEPWLLDVCLIYCLISFLTVVLLAKIKISEKQKEGEEDHD
jgi:Multisubunit Na+/H+ antiporter, MnhF subunit